MTQRGNAALLTISCPGLHATLLSSCDSDSSRSVDYQLCATNLPEENPDLRGDYFPLLKPLLRYFQARRTALNRLQNITYFSFLVAAADAHAYLRLLTVPAPL